MAEVTREPRSSVELGRTAAGDTTVTVKIYTDGDDFDAASAMNEAVSRYDALCVKYPLSQGQEAKRTGGK